MATEAATVPASRAELVAAGASDADELTIFYQPIVSAADNALVACEALVRWNGPGRDDVHSQFMRAAEQAALSAAMEESILVGACRQLQEWAHSDGEMTELGMWVNVSARQLNDPSFPAQLRSTLASSDVEASRLSLQVSETALFDLPSRRAALVMEQLMGTGVRIILDEFGRGETSLRQICQLPISAIKIDRAVLGHVGHDRFLLRTVGAMAAVADSLSVPLVATAARDANQLAAVIESGCRFVQGDAIARPMSPGDVSAWSSSRSMGAVVEAKQSESSPSAVGIGEAARDLGVSVSTIRRWADCGRLTSIRTPGGHRRILSADVGKEARLMMPAVRLNVASVPSEDLPATALLLERQGGEIIDAAAHDVYAARTSGWFSSATSCEARRLWVAAIGQACESAVYPEAIQASIDFFRQADAGGATVLERDLLIGRVRIRVIHLLRISHAEQSEIANVTRLMKAIEHAMLGEVGS